MATEEVSYVGTADGDVYKLEGKNCYQLQGGRWHSYHHRDIGHPELDPIELRTESRSEIKSFALKKALESLKSFKVDSAPMHFNEENIYYSPGNEDAPFASEGFLYALLGKEDGRSMLSRIRRLESVIEAL